MEDICQFYNVAGNGVSSKPLDEVLDLMMVIFSMMNPSKGLITSE